MIGFLTRYIIKLAIYFAMLLVLMAIGVLPSLAIGSMLGVAAILAAVNTLIRPVLVALALPFNVITFGIASVFANLLTLVIASAISGGMVTTGFWAMLLTALIIMIADDTIRLLRQAIKARKAGLDT